jgi:sporulation protein YlmC with PRC-barrel domain
VEGESFLGLEVRANDGTDLGRVTDVITDGATGEVTHLVLEWEGVDAEVPLSARADHGVRHRTPRHGQGEAPDCRSRRGRRP